MESFKWKAAWITLSWQKDANPLGESHLAFRKDYYLDREPTYASIKITASMRYSLWINGTYVGLGPARCYPKEQIYDEIDITKYLSKGKNAFAVLVHKPGGVTAYSLVNRMGLLIQGIINSGEQLEILTDTSWKTRNADWYIDTHYLITLPLGKQEHYNANLEPLDWKTADADEGWVNAFSLGSVGTPPWKNLHKSLINPSIIKPYTPYLFWRGKASNEKFDVRLKNLAYELNKSGVLGENTEHIKASDFISVEGGDVIVLDFEKTSYVSLGIQTKDLCGNIRFDLFYDISFNERRETSSVFGYESEGFCDSVELSQNIQQWSGLIPRGMRFLTIKVSGEGNCSLKLNMGIVEYGYAKTNFLISNNTVINKIWETSKTTLLSATTDVIAEPVRENVLWTFDACVGGKASYFSFGDTKMWQHCLELVANGIDEDGIPNAVVPAGYSFMILFDQSFYWIQSCKEFYEITGDRSFINKILPAAQRLISLCKQHITEDDLFIPPDYAWHWVDWAALNKKPYSLPINAMLLMAAQATEYMENELELKNGDSRYIVDTLSRSLLKFYDKKEGAFRSCIPVKIEGNVSSINSSQEIEFDLHGNALAYMTGLGTKDQRSSAVKKMLEILNAYSKKELEYGPVFGIAWTQIILEPLFSEGYIEEGIKYINEYCKPFLDVGAFTWGEDFTPTPYNTAHGWGACVNSLIIESMCGIRPLKPGFKEVRIKPCLPEGMDMECLIKTASGDIEFSYKNNRLEITVPDSVKII